MLLFRHLEGLPLELILWCDSLVRLTDKFTLWCRSCGNGNFVRFFCEAAGWAVRSTGTQNGCSPACGKFSHNFLCMCKSESIHVYMHTHTVTPHTHTHTHTSLRPHLYLFSFSVSYFDNPYLQLLISTYIVIQHLKL